MKIFYLHLFYWSIVFLSHAIVGVRKEGILVIPGVGRVDRLKIVVSNLKSLGYLFSDKSNDDWDCAIYVYANRDDIDFWGETEDITYLRTLCHFIEYPGKLVVENLFNVEPFLLESAYNYIFILLDDCRLRNETYTKFNVKRAIKIMKYNNLTVASPVVLGANKGGGQRFRKIMQANRIPGKEGYVTVFLELFAWIMTIPGYKGFWELLTPSINPYGWGYDLWYNNYATQNDPGHKMGIITSMQVMHDQDLTKSVRSDNTNPKEKWKAVKRQEQHFKRYRNIVLKGFKPDTNLRISSWSGVAIGYLESPPT